MMFSLLWNIAQHRLVFLRRFRT